MAHPSWILGIDFGTSFTVAVARVDGRPGEVIEIAGERRVPSVVLTEEGDKVVVGRVAEELSATNPESTLRRPKSRLGDQAPVVLAGKPYQVVYLVAALLAFVYEEAVRQMGGPPREVRLTHPATWNRPWLNRLQEAAVKAGLPRPLLVPEPVAAALSFAGEVGVAQGDYIAVYDLGGGTFDTAVVTATADGFSVVGRPGGDPSIGGELFDEILVNEIGSRLDPDVWESLQVGGDPTWQRVAASLRGEARRAKETLSSHPYADILLPLPSGLAQQRLTREEYDDLVRPYIDETVALLARCIANAGLEPRQLAAIYLVGGASRAPIVERLTTEAFPGVTVSRRGDPKTSVAMGAVQAVVGPDVTVASHGQRSTEDAAAPTAEGELVLGSPERPSTSLPEQAPGAHAAPTAPVGIQGLAGLAPAGPATTPVPPGGPVSSPPGVTSRPNVAPPGAPPPPITPPPLGSPPVTPPPVTPPPGYRQPVPTAAPPATAPSTTAHTLPLGGTAPKKSRRSLMLGIVAGIVALAVVIGGMIALTSGGGDDEGGSVGRTTEVTETTARPTTTIDETVPEIPVAEMEAKLLTLNDVNEAAGGGFAEVEPPEPGPLVCGLEASPTQSSVVRFFDNETSQARVVSFIDRYETLGLAREQFDREATLRTTCSDRSYTIDGVQYTVLILPFDEVIPTNGREYLGLLIGYSPDATTTTVAGAPLQPIYQFVVQAIDGANIVGTSYITYGRELTNDEISGYIDLFQLAVNRAVS